MKKFTFAPFVFVICSFFTAGCGQLAHKDKGADSSKRPAALGGDPSQTPAQNPSQTPAQNPSQSPAQSPAQSPTQTSQQAPVQPAAPSAPVAVGVAPVVVTTSAAPVPADRDLFVVIGGNGTCRSNRMSSDVPGLLSFDINESFNDAFLRSGLVIPADDVIYACYEWQSSSIQFYDLRLRAPMAPLNETQLLDVVLSRAQTFRQIILIGHSAGGWLAMKLAASPSLAVLPVKITLVTIDAISRVNCQRLRDPGCREAPSDLSPMEMAQLDLRDEWFNAWQRPGALLGSAPIPQADFNVEFFTNHPRIVREPAVWAAISQFLVGRL